ncbi:hypothetical protein ACVWZ6_001463 [Bradyrhizobium sp. GM6.1]
MLNFIKRVWFKTLYNMFGYLRPAPANRVLPPDADVTAEVQRLKTIDDVVIESTTPKKKPAAKVPAGSCVFFFAEGGSACAPGVTGGNCDKWGDWWINQGKNGWAQTEPTCPPGSKVYKV